MTDFTSLLSSIGGPAKSNTQQAGTKPTAQSSLSSKAQTSSNEVKVVSSNTTAGIKRKSEEPLPAAKPKIAKISSENVVPRNASSTVSGASASGNPNAPYRGTARSFALTAPSRPSQTSVAKSAPKPSTSTGIRNPINPTSATKATPKRGFASIMEKAKAAQEAAKATVSTGIKHKPVDRTVKRDRQRQQEGERPKMEKSKRPAVPSSSRELSPANAKGTVKKKAVETSYKGTMKKAPAPLAYKGTMRNLGVGEARPKPPVKKGMGQDKYGGYASWSDLDDAEEDEDEDEQQYESDGSSDMEAGWGDTEREELAALKFARREDEEAQQEEERLKREKLERKRRLQELSKNNAARRKY